jgi:hypothetical protein
MNGGYILERRSRYTVVHHNQVSFLNRSRAEGRRGILRCSTTTATSRGAGGTTSLAGRFMVLLLPPPSVTGRIEEYDGYNGGSDAERTGGRRNRCLSLRPVGGVGADTETERGVVSVGGCSSPRSDGGCDGDGAGVEFGGAGC